MQQIELVGKRTGPAGWQMVAFQPVQSNCWTALQSACWLSSSPTVGPRSTLELRCSPTVPTVDCRPPQCLDCAPAQFLDCAMVRVLDCAPAQQLDSTPIQLLDCTPDQLLDGTAVRQLGCIPTDRWIAPGSPREPTVTEARPTAGGAVTGMGPVVTETKGTAEPLSPRRGDHRTQAVRRSRRAAN